MSEPIRLDDKIHAVLERDPRMLDALLAVSPSFSMLKNPLMRKTMARLTTVEKAARVAGVDADELLGRLNAVLTGVPWEPKASAPAAATDAAPAGELPDAVKALTEVECDVRDDLRKGVEPFARIMGTLREVGPGKVLHLRAIFEPAPLYAVLGKKGFQHFTQRAADDDWHIWFWRDDAAGASAAASPAPAADDGGLPDDVIIIDVRGLEPPEPMMRTLAALEDLPKGKTLVQVNQRVPQFLIPQLGARGFVYEVREQSEDLVRIFIRHAS